MHSTLEAFQTVIEIRTTTPVRGGGGVGEGGSEREGVRGEGVRGRKEYMYKEEGLERGMMEEEKKRQGRKEERGRRR